MNNHLTFMNVPINGDINSFVDKLKTLGFEVKSDGLEVVEMEGLFGGANREIAIFASACTYTVHRVAITLTRSDRFYSLKSAYMEYKSLLTRKYGAGESVEMFLDPFEEGDGCEESALSCGKCLYTSEFKVNEGKISLYILCPEGSYEGFVWLVYDDNYNTVLAEEENNDNIMSYL